MPTPNSANAMALGTALDPRHSFSELRELAARIVLEAAERASPLENAADELRVGRSTFFRLLRLARAIPAQRTIDRKKRKRS